MEKYITFQNNSFALTDREEELSFAIESVGSLPLIDESFTSKLATLYFSAKSLDDKAAYKAALSCYLESLGVTQKSDVFEDVRRYIENNLGEKLTDDMLADEFFMSKYHLIREFKKKFGTTPMKYHELQRMERAKELLKNTDMPIKKIGESLGYFDDIYFSRVFKKNCGTSCSYYRKTTTPQKEDKK